MKTLCKIFSLLLFTQLAYSQSTVQLSDYEMLDGTKWEGFLTYKDYQSGKQRRIDATMQIKIKNEKVMTSIQYVYEPDKSETSQVKIRKNGTYYGSEKVMSNTFENGMRTIVTRYKGKDNGKTAFQYEIYKFNEDTFTKTKEVQYMDGSERFVRNQFTFNRIEN